MGFVFDEQALLSNAWNPRAGSHLAFVLDAQGTAPDGAVQSVFT